MQTVVSVAQHEIEGFAALLLGRTDHRRHQYSERTCWHEILSTDRRPG